MQMPPLEAIRGKLIRAQSTFFRAADTIPVAKWGATLGINQWSAAELVSHLVVVERAVVGKADQITKKIPLQIPFRKRLHLPMWLVETRIIRLKSPVPLDPSLMAEKEAMLATLRGARERTLAFISETERRDLSPYYWRHRFWEC